MKQARLPYVMSTPALFFCGTLLLIPIAMTFILSFMSFTASGGLAYDWNIQNYIVVATDPYYLTIFWRTLYMSIVITVICVLIGTPEAFILFRMSSRWRGIFLLIILGPMLIAVVVRTLGWALFFGSNGMLTQAMQGLGIADGPVSLMYTMSGVIIALVHVLVPFMVIAVWTALQRCNPEIAKAAASLGARPHVVLLRIVLPQIMPGILSGTVVVFSLSATAFATPAIIGGRRLKVVATAAHDEFLTTLDWPLGAAIAVLLLAANVAILMSYNHFIRRRFEQVFE